MHVTSSRRGITIDERLDDGIENITAPGIVGHPMYSSEYTSWTALSDLRRLQFSVRSYDSLNYIDFDLAALKNETQHHSIALKSIPIGMTAGAEILKKK